MKILREERDNEIILSMADKWDLIRSQMQSHFYRMFEHLIKVYYYHNYSQYLRGWITSIRKGFEHISKLVNTHKYPTKEQILDEIWKVWLDNDEDFDQLHIEIVDEINNSYDEIEPIEHIDLIGFNRFAKQYCELLAEKLSKKGSISTDEITNFINNYFNEN